MIKISINSIVHDQIITLPANLEQLKFTYKKLFNLNDKQLSKLKIFYMEKEVKKNLETDKEYMDFYLGEHPDLIQAELENENIEINKDKDDKIQIPKFINIEDNNYSLRCLEKDCFLIPYITLNKDKDNNIVINYKCRNNHKGENIPIDSYKSFFNKKLEDLLCSFCSLNNEKDKNIKLYYCCSCKKYICNLEKCNNNHEKQCNNNNLIQLEKIDSDCIIHGKSLIYFCEDCQVSFCNLCKNHQDHKKKIIDEINIKEEEKEKKIKMIDNNLKELEIIYNNIKEKIMNKLSNIYEANKKLLQLNKKIIENLNQKEINGEIYMNFNNCQFIKKIKLQENLEYYNNEFKQIEDHFTNSFFEFDEKQKSFMLKYLNRIPIIITFTYRAKKNLKIKSNEPKKYLVPPEMTVSQLILRIRQNIKTEESLYLLINGKTTIDYSRTFEEIHDKYKKDDYILYFELETEFRMG